MVVLEDCKFIPSKFIDEMASDADFGAGAASGDGVGAGGGGRSTEMADMASAGVRLSAETVCGTFWSEGRVGGMTATNFFKASFK